MITHNRPLPKNVTFPRDLGSMSLFEITRWFALIEAVNIIADECTERGIKFHKELEIKSKPIQKYVNKTSDSLAEKYERFLNKGGI